MCLVIWYNMFFNILYWLIKIIEKYNNMNLIFFFKKNVNHKNKYSLENKVGHDWGMCA